MAKKYIDCEAVIEKLCDRCGECLKAKGKDCAVVRIMDKIPAADVAPVVHAHWVEKKHSQYPDIYNSKHFCSYCNKEAPTYYLDYSHDIISEKWDYCPHCGAKMDISEEDDDE